MLKGVGHIGIFVQDLEKTLDGLTPLFGGQRPEVKERADIKVIYALVEAGPVQLEIIEDQGGQTLVGKAVAEKGDHIHHFCLIGDELEQDIKGLKGQGIEFIAEEPWIGVRGKRVIFTESETTGGFPVEISEP